MSHVRLQSVLSSFTSRKTLSTSNSLKKKKKREECDREKRKEDGDRGERKKEEEADEKAVEKERKEKRKEGRRGIEERKEDREENRECGAKDAQPPPPPPPRDAFPSQKLGNNMTPIKGRLWKNTTPTQRDPEKLIHRRQRNPSEDSRTSSIPPMQIPSTRCEVKNLKKHRIQRQQSHHL